MSKPLSVLQYHVSGAIERGEKEAISAVRPLWEIAANVRADWKNVYFGAVPYLNAMSGLVDIDENYGADSAKEMVLYFLANAQSWKGPVARQIKAELKKIAGLK